MNARAETRRAQTGTLVLGWVVPNFASQLIGQGWLSWNSLVKPYRVLEETYRDVVAALKHEKTRQTLRKPASPAAFVLWADMMSTDGLV
jgi:hypothetical protein